uniref:Laminin G domain-containing protein n=1 Tax=Seriola dumerili TaxID=41447 RepID=A0A3B4U454_SERDU
MYAGKVSLVWDVGSGSTRLDFPGLDITNNRWTRINATRFGAHVSLSVHQLESELAPLPTVRATSPGSSRVLDINRNTVIHIGGMGGHTQFAVLRSSTFQGCLGEASLNERNIGLWNYDSKEGECGGCFSSPQAEETSFHFDGSGFSLVQKSLRATSTSIVLLFKTLSPGGLLLYLASNNTRDFLSMELVEGHVRLTFDLGSGALILTSNRKYNTGVWYKITLQRNKRKGTTATNVRGGGWSGWVCFNSLSLCVVARRQVVSRSYIGCIKNVEIARSNFDLLRDAYGVRKGCVLEVRHTDVKILNLYDSGDTVTHILNFYHQIRLHSHLKINLLPKTLSRKICEHRHIEPLCVGVRAKFPAISCSVWFIQTQSHDLHHQPQYCQEEVSHGNKGGGILVSRSLCKMRLNPVVSLSVVSVVSVSVVPVCYVCCVASLLCLSLLCPLRCVVLVLSVSVKMLIRSRALDGLILLLSDSKHMDFIVLRLMGGRLSMSADMGKGPASITSSVIISDGEWHTVSSYRLTHTMKTAAISFKGNQLDVDNRLYLGGLPHTHSTRRINVSSSFPGCVRSVSLNGAMLDLTKPASQHDVTSCFIKDQTGSYFNGSGYAVLMHDGYKVGSDVSVTLEFRTSQSEGVFLGISSAKVDAIGIEMISGQVVFHVNNGAGRVSVRSVGQVLCDGQWHHLLARKTKHTLSLSVDGRSYTIPNPYPQSTSAETNNPVYLGGYPDGVKQNCLSISSRFRGCLRNLKLIKSHLSDALDLSSAHVLLGVTPNSCPVALQHPTWL